MLRGRLGYQVQFLKLTKCQNERCQCNLSLTLCLHERKWKVSRLFRLGGGCLIIFLSLGEHQNS